MKHISDFGKFNEGIFGNLFGSKTPDINKAVLKIEEFESQNPGSWQARVFNTLKKAYDEKLGTTIKGESPGGRLLRWNTSELDQEAASKLFLKICEVLDKSEVETIRLKDNFYAADGALMTHWKYPLMVYSTDNL